MTKVLNQHIDEFYSCYHGDSCEVIKGIPDNSIGYTITSPPFSSLYVFSNSDRDMSNNKDHKQFFEHFRYLAEELYRVTMPGREVSIHCMNLPTTKARDGVIGITDFRGMVIRLFQEVGFIYHAEHCIWKSPVVAMQRTKSIRLLWKQIKKDSSISGSAIPDYLVTFRKPGENPQPIKHTDEEFPVDLWSKYASPIWMDITPSDTLQKKSCRDEEDERHISLLQLEVIKRGICLWSNPGDIVLDPFAGIFSTTYMALRLDRRAIGCELKDSYYIQGVENCKMAIKEPIIDITTELSDIGLNEEHLIKAGAITY